MFGSLRRALQLVRVETRPACFSDLAKYPHIKIAAVVATDPAGPHPNPTEQLRVAHPGAADAARHDEGSLRKKRARLKS